jgi:DNA-binding CsgD family transcriptional regulator
LLLASQGLRHSEIAACLGISPRQVGRLLSQGRDRNGCATTSELIARAIAARVILHEASMESSAAGD